MSDSILWILPPATGHEIVAKQAEALGISRNRLLFGDFLNNHTEHLERATFANLLLDTCTFLIPFSVGYFCCSAVWHLLLTWVLNSTLWSSHNGSRFFVGWSSSHYSLGQAQNV